MLAQKDKDGRMYYTFEFASKASNYIRHALAVVTVANGGSPSIVGRSCGHLFLENSIGLYSPTCIAVPVLLHSVVFVVIGQCCVGALP